ncbi:hypothetical protein P3342_009854 [Pyrenophora teres f. teres]|nr:hypothetical protein P3342_009854 [Pyrenophora teres f. teres]
MQRVVDSVLKEFVRRKNLPQNSGVTFGMGAIAGIITVYATQPFETLKALARWRHLGV